MLPKKYIVREINNFPKRNSMNQRDDIILVGKDREEYNRTLEKVLLRTREYGVKFNREKSEFDKTEITFFGHLFTSEGLKYDPMKIEIE